MYILMCVQQTDQKKKEKQDLQNVIRKCWQSGSVTLRYTQTHTHTHTPPADSIKLQSSIVFPGWTCSHKEFVAAQRLPSSQVNAS